MGTGAGGLGGLKMPIEESTPLPGEMFGVAPEMLPPSASPRRPNPRLFWMSYDDSAATIGAEEVRRTLKRPFLVTEVSVSKLMPLRRRPATWRVKVLTVPSS